jgi:hypothetical protein
VIIAVGVLHLLFGEQLPRSVQLRAHLDVPQLLFRIGAMKERATGGLTPLASNGAPPQWGDSFLAVGDQEALCSSSTSVQSNPNFVAIAMSYVPYWSQHVFCATVKISSKAA